MPESPNRLGIGATVDTSGLSPNQNRAADDLSRLNGLETSDGRPGIKFTAVDAPSKFIKTVSFLDGTRAPFVKVTVRLPTIDQSTATDINIFEIPYNYVESFEYDIGGEASLTGTIKVKDISGFMTETLMMRFLVMAQSPYFAGSPRVRVEFGWVRPYRKFNRKIENKLFFRQHIDAIVENVETDFGDAGIDMTIKIRADANSVLGPVGQTIRPYMVLGPLPLLNFLIERLLRVADEAFKDLEDANTLFASIDENSVGNLSRLPPKVQAFLRSVEKDYGIKNSLDKLELIKVLYDVYNQNAGDIQTLLSYNILSAQEATPTRIDPPINDAPVNLVDQRVPSFFDLLNKIKTKLEPAINKFYPRLCETRIHPWVAFTYFVRMMRFQIDRIGSGYNNKLAVVPLIFIDEDEDIIGLTKDEARLASDFIGAAPEDAPPPANQNNAQVQTANTTEFLKGDSIKVSLGTTWDQIFRETLSKVKVKDKPSDPERRPERSGTRPVPPVTASHKLISANTTDEAPESVENEINGISQASGSSENSDQVGTTESGPQGIRGLKNKMVLRILKQLATIERTDGQRANSIGDRLNKYNQFEQVIRERQEAGVAEFLYIIVSEENAGTIFSDDRWQNKILATYSFRFKKPEDGDRFLSGRRLLTEGDFPDVLSFKPKFNLFEATRASFSNFINGSSSNGNSEIGQIGQLRTDAEAEEERKKANEQKALEEETKLIREELKKAGEVKPSQARIEEVRRQRNQEKQAEAEKQERLRKNQEAIRNLYPIGGNLEFYKQQFPSADNDSDDAIMIKRSLQNFRRRLALSAQSIEAEIEIEGEPAYSDAIVGSVGNMILLKIYDHLGAESLFSGIYYVDSAKHVINAGSFRTTMNLRFASYGTGDDLYGYEEYLIGRDGLTQQYNEAGGQTRSQRLAQNSNPSIPNNG